MKSILHALTVLAAVCWPAAAAESAFTGPKEKLHVFLLVGQSNMAGRAKIEPADAGVIERAFLLNDKTWEPAKAPLNRYSKHRKGLGMQRLNCGPSFAKEYLKANPGACVGIVCSARGGTSIGQWAKSKNKSQKTSLYEAAVSAARQAQKTGVLKGILWHQGESDTRGGMAAYPKKLEELIANFRKDLGAKDLPFVYGQIAPRKEWAKFNEMLAKQPAVIPHTACATTEGLTTLDRVHFDTKSQRTLGQRYAEKMLQLLQRKKKPPAARGPAGASGRTKPLQVSGIYPHLAAFNKPDPHPKTRASRGGGAECGIGAVVPWAGKLWTITYSPHCPGGSSDKLYAIDADLTMRVRPESVGGTPAGRMIHRESNQLFIGPYAIDEKGKVRVIPPSRMPGRHTGIARHLTDPANKVYYFDMEGAIHEVHVHTLTVKKLFAKPVAGWHGKGAYTGQGRYIIANNGEFGRKTYKNVLAGGPPKNREEMGALAEWDGKQWRIVERKQFCDVTGPGGIHGSPDDKSPVWSIGWDRRSVILKLLSGGKWYTFRMPKGTHTYDHRGGFYTEWPRIREIMPGKLMMDMHGVFWDFPKNFDLARTGGIRPMSTHLRYVPDFCHWNGRVVLATDETAMVGGNKMAGQSQSNLWFGTLEALHNLGPRSAWGGPWVRDAVKAGQPSQPFLINGFARRCLHLSTAAGRPDGSATRCTGRFPITDMPAELAALQRVTIDRGDFHRPAPPYSFTVDRDVEVYLAVDDRGGAEPGDRWRKTETKLTWQSYTDTIYRKAFKKGRVSIPGNDKPHKTDAYGVPHTCFIDAAVKITDLPKSKGAQVARPNPSSPTASAEVTFRIELDVKGDGRWTQYKSIRVPPGGYQCHIFPPGLEANWIRCTVDTDTTATAFFHLSSHRQAPKTNTNRNIFAAIAEVDDARRVAAGLIRPGGHNRNLQYLAATAGQETYFEVDQTLTFTKPAESRADEVKKIAAVTKEFDVDEASVIMTHSGRRYRLPKGDSRYDKPFAAGWPRGTRECESERYLVNIHGTFYEKPREAGLPRLKPVATHGKQILDFCTWRGLLVISGTRTSAIADGQYFRASDGPGLWFGGIDDLWKLGKPVGRGGPWRSTAVKANTPSDPYLMTNYDKKTVELSHDASEGVTFTIEVNVDHTGWHVYKSLEVPPGKKRTHEFPDGFGAHWVRLRAGKPCKATAYFIYQ